MDETKDKEAESEKWRQEARAMLRERFLRVCTGLQGRQAKFQMFGSVCVEAEFGGLGIDFQDVFVKRLKTPMGTMNTALLRSTDILSIQIPIEANSEESKD